MKKLLRIFASLICFVSLFSYSQPKSNTKSVSPKQNTAAAAMQITEETVFQLVKTQSPDYQDVQNQLLNAEYIFEQTNQIYRLNLNLDYSLEHDNFINTGVGASPDANSKIGIATVTKRFSTGTILGASYTNDDYRADSLFPSFKQNFYSVSLEQNIFPYVLSNSEGLDLKAAKAVFNAEKLQNQIDLLTATRDAIALFWKIEVAQKAIAENQDLLAKYENLVAVVSRKKANNYANPGDYEIAVAEYETRKQELFVDTNTLETLKQQLKASLNIPAEQNIEIITPNVAAKALPPVFNGDVKKTQHYEVQKLKTQAAEDSYSASSWRDAPAISLYGKYSGQGFAQTQSQAWENFTDHAVDQYVIGVKLNYYFDNELVTKEKAFKRGVQDTQTSRFVRYEDDLKSQIANAYQKLENAYNNLQTTQNVVKYRAEAVKQLLSNYNQGRTDISILIAAFNNKNQAMIDAVTASGDYSTSLLDYQNLVQ